jgi:hypothetical protein
MTSLLPISAAELLDEFEDSIRKHPKSALRMIIWLMIYHELAASWTRDFLEKKGVFPKPSSETEKKNQLRKIDRTRQSLEKSVNLPIRAKKGATPDYKDALIAWKRINPKPPKNELLAGWTPQRLPSAQDGRPEQSAQSTVPGSEPAVETPARPSAPVVSPVMHEPEKSIPTKKSGSERPANHKPLFTAEELRKLSQQESEHQRQAYQPKKPEPTPPVFRGTPPPPMNASEEERVEWRKISKKEKEEYILSAPSLGWEISAEWDGLQPVANFAKWIGLPPV